MYNYSNYQIRRYKGSNDHTKLERQLGSFLNPTITIIFD